MATGRLGVADLSATSVTDVYTVPANKIASFSVSVCNRNASTPVTIRLALGDTGTTQGTDEYIEYGRILNGGEVLERTGLVLDAGKILSAYASTTGISVVVYGFEEAA
jgi:hypothetical protein